MTFRRTSGSRYQFSIQHYKFTIPTGTAVDIKAQVFDFTFGNPLEGNISISGSSVEGSQFDWQGIVLTFIRCGTVARGAASLQTVTVT
ncbi:MAG: hypothetical protein BWX60_01011 [Candidatus Marinimicrobia bacterium ADurb.Bin030]|nr:MAG: hypothetical protein BWX60_01011 [Candidatus Marinimicrobia bacterium ADurb.Bin030]